MQIPKEVSELQSQFHTLGFDLYCVGGCVRDSLLGQEPHDWDLCTNAKPQEIIQVLKSYDIPYTTVGEQYGTIVCYIHEQEYEITTFRKDGNYSDGRRPDTVFWGDTIEEDLCRRDFTINAMAYDGEELIDPFYGQQALQQKKLIAVGNANTRIKEDALRILRALRFAITYGLTMDEELSKAIHENKHLLTQISKERITDEFRKIFQRQAPVSSIFMEYADVIATIIPEIAPCIGFWQNNKYHKHDVYEHILAVTDACKSNKFEIKMAALLHDIGKPGTYKIGDDGYGHFHGHAKASTEISKSVLSNDFRVTNKEEARILELVEYHDMLNTTLNTPKLMKRALFHHSEEFLRDWFVLKQADMDDHIYPDDKFPQSVDTLIPILDKVIEEESCFSLKDLQVDGSILMQEFALQPGKEIGQTLQILLDKVIDEELPNDKTKLLYAASEILQKPYHPDYSDYPELD